MSCPIFLSLLHVSSPLTILLFVPVYANLSMPCLFLFTEQPFIVYQPPVVTFDLTLLIRVAMATLSMLHDLLPTVPTLQPRMPMLYRFIPRNSLLCGRNRPLVLPRKQVYTHKSQIFLSLFFHFFSYININMARLSFPLCYKFIHQ